MTAAAILFPQLRCFWLYFAYRQLSGIHWLSIVMLSLSVWKLQRIFSLQEDDCRNLWLRRSRFLSLSLVKLRAAKLRWKFEFAGLTSLIVIKIHPFGHLSWKSSIKGAKKPFLGYGDLRTQIYTIVLWKRHALIIGCVVRVIIGGDQTLCARLQRNWKKRYRSVTSHHIV